MKDFFCFWFEYMSIIGIAGAILAAVFAAINGASCEQYLETKGLEGFYKFPSGCYIEVDGENLTQDEYSLRILKG